MPHAKRNYTIIAVAVTIAIAIGGYMLSSSYSRGSTDARLVAGEDRDTWLIGRLDKIDRTLAITLGKVKYLTTMVKLNLSITRNEGEDYDSQDYDLQNAVGDYYLRLSPVHGPAVNPGDYRLQQ